MKPEIRNVNVHWKHRKEQKRKEYFINDKWTVVCPFHGERTPSCVIDTVAKQFHCFGCGRTGSAWFNGGGENEHDDGMDVQYETWRLQPYEEIAS
jgi:hypothetical protein